MPTKASERRVLYRKPNIVNCNNKDHKTQFMTNDA